MHINVLFNFIRNNNIHINDVIHVITAIKHSFNATLITVLYIYILDNLC